MRKDNRPIGIFDSGLGGLTVVAALRDKMPGESMIYLGDTARVPYGDKSPDSIIRYGIEDVEFLLSQGVKLVIAACNTVSSVAICELRGKFPDIPIISVLEAGVEACLEMKPSSVLVIATKATVRSDSYRKSIHARDSSVSVTSIAAPLFVPIVEEGLQEHPISLMAMDIYLKDTLANPPDCVVLACTHYPILKKRIQTYFGRKVSIIDSAAACADHSAKFIATKSLSSSGRSVTEKYFVTDMPSSFYRQASRFLGRELDNFEKISL